MIILAGPTCNYILKFLHLAGENKTGVYGLYTVIHIHLWQKNILPVDSGSFIVHGSIYKESTSSFSFFRQFCKLFTFSCSCLSLSRSPVFSLLDSSSCSYYNRIALTWTWMWLFNMRVNFFSVDKHALTGKTFVLLSICLIYEKELWE